MSSMPCIFRPHAVPVCEALEVLSIGSPCAAALSVLVCNVTFAIGDWCATRYNCHNCGAAFCDEHLLGREYVAAYGYSRPVPVCAKCQAELRQACDTMARACSATLQLDIDALYVANCAEAECAGLTVLKIALRTVVGILTRY
jgi:hypothetical protein